MNIFEVAGGGFVTIAGYLIRWRGPYLACYGYGSFLAMQQGITIDRQAAYELGKTAILQKGANAATTAWSAIDWKAVGIGLAHWRSDLHEAVADIGRGIRRDATRAWLWVHGRLEPKDPPPRTETDQTITLLDEAMTVAESNTPMAEDAAVAASGLAWDLEQRRAVLRDELMNPATRSSLATVREHMSIRRALAQHYDENPADAAAMSTQRGLLSQANAFGTFSSLNPMRLYAMGAAVVFAIGGWTWGWERNNRVSHVVEERNHLKANYETLAGNRQQWIDYAKGLRGQVTQASAQARSATETIEAERARTRAAAAKKRKTDDAIKAALAGSAAPDWSGLLDGASGDDAGKPAVSGGGKPDPAG